MVRQEYRMAFKKNGLAQSLGVVKSASLEPKSADVADEKKPVVKTETDTKVE
jgi:hypothetical protein